jgi:hypothetical protein
MVRPADGHLNPVRVLVGQPFPVVFHPLRQAVVPELPAEEQVHQGPLRPGWVPVPVELLFQAGHHLPDLFGPLVPVWCLGHFALGRWCL